MAAAHPLLCCHWAVSGCGKLIPAVYSLISASISPSPASDPVLAESMFSRSTPLLARTVSILQRVCAGQNGMHEGRRIKEISFIFECFLSGTQRAGGKQRYEKFARYKAYKDESGFTINASS